MPALPATNDNVTVAPGSVIQDTPGSDYYTSPPVTGAPAYSIIFDAGTSNAGDVDVVENWGDGILYLHGDVSFGWYRDDLVIRMVEMDLARGEMIDHYVYIPDYESSNFTFFDENGQEITSLNFTVRNPLSNGDDYYNVATIIEEYWVSYQVVHGLNGNDTFLIDKGNHQVYGGGGDDIYIIPASGMSSTIFDTAGDNDRLIIEGMPSKITAAFSNGFLAHNLYQASAYAEIANVYGRVNGIDYLETDDGSGTRWRWNGSHTDGLGIVSMVDGTTLSTLPFTGTDEDDILIGGIDSDGLTPLVFGGLGDDVIVGTAGPQDLRGEAGDDVLISNSPFRDVLRGGDGNDIIFVRGGGVYTNGFSGDYASGGTGDDLFVLGGDTVNINGEDGSDTIFYDVLGSDIRVDLSQERGVGGAALGDIYRNVENVVSSNGNDVLIGNDSANTLVGNNGNDVLIGGAGADRLWGGGGIDTISYSNADSGVTILLNDGRGERGDADGDTYLGIEAANGSNFDDIIIGDAAANTLKGLDGDDLLMGGAGADRLEGGSGFDTVSFSNATAGVAVYLSARMGTAGDAAGDVYIDIEAANGSGFDDIISGDASGNTLKGMGGDDQLSGGAGNDILIGGAGHDRLSGGTGADRFIYSETADSGVGPAGRDLITDFNRVEGDLIDLSAIDAQPGNAGNQAFSFIGTDAFTGELGQVRYIHTSIYQVVEIDLDGDRATDMQIRVNGVSDLLASDFVL